MSRLEIVTQVLAGLVANSNMTDFSEDERNDLVARAYEFAHLIETHADNDHASSVVDAIYSVNQTLCEIRNNQGWGG